MKKVNLRNYGKAKLIEKFKLFDYTLLKYKTWNNIVVVFPEKDIKKHLESL